MEIALRHFAIESARGLGRTDLSAGKRGHFKYFLISELRSGVELLGWRWRGRFFRILRVHERDTFLPITFLDTSASGRAIRLSYLMRLSGNRASPVDLAGFIT